MHKRTDILYISNGIIVMNLASRIGAGDLSPRKEGGKRQKASRHHTRQISVSLICVLCYSPSEWKLLETSRAIGRVTAATDCLRYVNRIILAGTFRGKQRVFWEGGRITRLVRGGQEVRRALCFFNTFWRVISMPAGRPTDAMIRRRIPRTVPGMKPSCIRGIRNGTPWPWSSFLQGRDYRRPGISD